MKNNTRYPCGIFIFTVIFTVFMVFIFIGCFSPWAGEEGILVIRLPGGARSAILSTEAVEKLSHTFVLSSAGKKDRIIGPTSDTELRISLAPGLWKIYVEAISPDGKIAARGSGECIIEPGKTKPAKIVMSVLDDFVKPFFAAGESYAWEGETIPSGMTLGFESIVDYQWYKVIDDEDYELIPGATAPNYTVTDSLVNDSTGAVSIFVEVTNTYSDTETGTNSQTTQGNLIKVYPRTIKGLASAITDAGDGGTVELPEGDFFVGETLYIIETSTMDVSHINNNATLTTRPGKETTLKRSPGFLGNFFKMTINNISFTLIGNDGGKLFLDGALEGGVEADNSIISIDTGTMEISDGVTLKNNNYRLEGSGVKVIGYDAKFILSGNAALTGNRSDVGVVYVHLGSFTMKGGVIDGNTSSGVWIFDGEFSMESGTISNNTNNGVSIKDTGKFTMSGGSIENHENGSGVWLEGNLLEPITFIMKDDAQIIGNKTPSMGGGIYMWGTVSVTMSGNAAISNNEAGDDTRNTGFGGGVYMERSGMNAEFVDYPSFTMNGGIINGNRAINRNADSTDAGNGGGVYMIGGTFSMKSSEAKIINNFATGLGGGIFKFTGAGAFIEINDNITGNIAERDPDTNDISFIP